MDGAKSLDDSCGTVFPVGKWVVPEKAGPAEGPFPQYSGCRERDAQLLMETWALRPSTAGLGVL